MNDEISDLRFFLQLVEAGRLAEAARRSGASLAAVSRRLATMESRLGAKLIERSARRFFLTQEGAAVVERGRELIAELDAIQDDIRHMAGSPRGHIRVGMPVQIGRRRFAPWVAAFTRNHPAVAVELVLTDGPIDLLDDGLDVAFMIGQPSGVNTISRCLLRSRSVLCASPAYIEREGAPTSPDALAQHACLCLIKGRWFPEAWMFQDGETMRAVTVVTTLSTNNAEVLHDWALSGEGVALKAFWDVEEDLANGRLIELLPGLLHSPVDLYLAYGSRLYLPQRVRVFIDFLVTRLGEAGNG
jgi:DNA-binding transcriptional LysR family regulator